MDPFKLRLHKLKNHQFTSQPRCSSSFPLLTREVGLEPSHLRWLSSFKCLQAGSPLKFPHTRIKLHLYGLSLVYVEEQVFHNRHKTPTPSFRSKPKSWRKEKSVVRVIWYHLLPEVKLVKHKPGSSVVYQYCCYEREWLQIDLISLAKGMGKKNAAPLIL